MASPSLLCDFQDEFLDLCSKEGVRFWHSVKVLPSQSVLARCGEHAFGRGMPPTYREVTYEEAVVFSVMAR